MDRLYEIITCFLIDHVGAAGSLAPEQLWIIHL